MTVLETIKKHALDNNDKELLDYLYNRELNIKIELYESYIAGLTNKIEVLEKKIQNLEEDCTKIYQNLENISNND